MAMLDIEYRFSDGPLGNEDIRRKTVKQMETYLRDLVFEMQAADISAKFETSAAKDGEANTVLINGKTIQQILEGVELCIPEPDEDSCSCGKPAKVTFGERPMFEWDERFVEDVPDAVMKNAIAKVYADMQANRIL